MERYWLFAYTRYYPSGGFKDFVGSFSTVEEAVEKEGSITTSFGKSIDEGDAHIFDSVEQKIVWYRDRDKGVVKKIEAFERKDGSINIPCTGHEFSDYYNAY